MKKTFLLMLAFHAATLAQVPSMLKDISPGNTSTSLSDIVTLPGDNILFLTHSTASAASGLWVSDGSTAGTNQLANVTVRSGFGELNGLRFFAAVGTNSVFALWGSNGSAAGTFSIPLPGLEDITTLHTVNNRIVFFGQTNAGNTEVWSTDGSATGTFSMMTLSSAQGFTVINNIFYFSGTTATNGKELYRSDGTLAGTYLLKDVWPGGGSSFNINPIAGIYNNNIFLVMNDGTSGEELWKTDGTTAGTQLLKDIFPGSGGAGMFANSFKLGPNGFYFMANDQTHGNELWYSDGTSANTNMIQDLVPGTGGSAVTNITFAANNAYYFYGLGIYKTNGTTAGTSSLSVLKEFPNGPNHYFHDLKLYLYNNELYFVSIIWNNFQNINDTIVLNKVDLNLNRTSVARLPHNLISASGGVFSQFSNATTLTGPHFVNFFRTDNQKLSIAIFNLATGNHKIHYQMGDVSVFQLIHPFNGPAVGNKLYLPFTKNGIRPAYLDLANDSIYPLTAGATVGYACGTGPESPWWWHKSYNLNNKTYFLASESAYGLEFFGTDYTISGTARIKDINPGAGNFDNNNNINNCGTGIWYIHQTASNLYFGADDGSNGFELWSLYNTPGNPVATEDEKKAKNFTRIFPNPAGAQVNVSCDTRITNISLYSVTGSILKSTAPGKNEASVDLSDIAQGIYMLQITSGDLTVVRKIVRE